MIHRTATVADESQIADDIEASMIRFPDVVDLRGRLIRLKEATVWGHVPPMVQGVQFRHMADAVLMVLASNPHDADETMPDCSELIRMGL